MRMMRVLLAGQCWPELCSSCGYYPCRLRLSALLWRMGWRTAIGPLSTGKAGVRIEPARADKVTVFISMAECYHLYSWRVSRSRHVHSRLCLILVSSSPAVCLQCRQEATCCSISLLHCRTIWLWGGGSESSLVTAAQSDLQSHSGRCNHMRVAELTSPPQVSLYHWLASGGPSHSQSYSRCTWSTDRWSAWTRGTSPVWQGSASGRQCSRWWAPPLQRLTCRHRPLTAVTAGTWHVTRQLLPHIYNFYVSLCDPPHTVGVTVVVEHGSS